MAEGHQPSPPARRPSLAARVLGGGARGAEAVARVTGVDDVVERAVEEAIVRALESEAVERAVVRVAEGPALEETVRRVLASPAVERAIIEALDSKLVDRVWDHVLQSDETQKLIERIADAPEVRQAVAAQGIGLVDDLGRQVRRVAGHFDNALERVARLILRRPQRAEPTDHAGIFTRGLAFAIDLAILNLAFWGLAGLAHSAAEALSPRLADLVTPGLALGLAGWALASALYALFFWTLAGQTPGMRLLAIRLDPGGGERALPFRRGLRRLWWILLSLLPLGLGFIGVLLRDDRRALHDRKAGTEVVPDASKLRLGWFRNDEEKPDRERETPSGS